jgi:hypothetical protein
MTCKLKLQIFVLIMKTIPRVIQASCHDYQITTSWRMTSEIYQNYGAKLEDHKHKLCNYMQYFKSWVYVYICKEMIAFDFTFILVFVLSKA